MNLEDLIAQRRTLSEKSSLIGRRNAHCLTLAEIEALALEDRSPDRPLCERCASLVEIFKDLVEIPDSPPIKS